MNKIRISKSSSNYKVLTNNVVDKSYPWEVETTHPKVTFDMLTEQFYIELPKNTSLIVEGMHREAWAFTVAEKLYGVPE